VARFDGGGRANVGGGHVGFPSRFGYRVSGAVPAFAARPFLDLAPASKDIRLFFVSPERLD